MNKISKTVKTKEKLLKTKPVVNFMGGISYELNPLDTLKMISASSIFGEPAYYRDGINDGSAYLHELVAPFAIFEAPKEKTSDIMIDAINKALEYDFKATLEWAVTLRKDYYMRLNPQIIMVLAATHPARIAFNAENPNLFRELNMKVMSRADEPASQLSSYIYLNGSKNGIPSVLKRSWANRITSMKRYEMAKYKNADIGLINTIRVCHAKSELVDELMTTGTIEVKDEDKTWENLRSAGMSWTEILNTISIPHMALIRNLRGIFSEITDEDLTNKILDELKSKVLEGKQFPFRYYQAYKIIENAEGINHQPQILDALEECIDIAVANMPKLKGKTICLSDNSGSAWNHINSEYGSVVVAEIDNLSSVITGMNSDEGYIGKFGDRLSIVPVSKRNGVLAQTKKLSEDSYDDVGGSTENGIWLFFQEAIEKKVHYDNIFIYSDMQAGHGGLYGIGKAYLIDGEDFSTGGGYHAYVDVMKLINKYRSTVNSKVNVFCVQTAGYNNVLIPEFTYRGAVLYGWTGKEPVFASEIIKQWDEIESRNNEISEEKETPKKKRGRPRKNS